MANIANPLHGAPCSRAGLYSAVLPLLIFAGLCLLWPAVARGQVFEVQWPWISSLDLDLRLRLDGLSLLFALIVSGAGFFVTVYSADYMSGHRGRGRFFVFLHAFMLSMLGIVLADNLLLLFVFWEATTIFSYLLIGFDHESQAARENARQALLITGGGGLALLVGILLLKLAGISWIPSQWLTSGAALRQHPWYPFIFTAVLLGAMSKSAQFPFHFWLPNAMSAPTPISAFLHAATMVKAGIYLLMRFHPLLGGTPVWMGTLVLVGGITAVWGSLQALEPHDLKRKLAYTTMMGLGILTMFLGGSTVPTLTAAATFLLVHALYKAALFLAVGSIEHETGTRRLDELGGLWRAMPLTALAVAAAALSMAGFPLFFGFIGKEIMYEGALTQNIFPVFATLAALLSNAIMTAVAGIILLGPFAGRRPPDMTDVCEAPWTMRLGPAVMGILGIVFGLIPGWVSTNLIRPAVLAIHPKEEPLHLSLFHGVSAPLLLSILTLSLGGAVYLQRRRAHEVMTALLQQIPLTTQGLYGNGLRLFLKSAAWATTRLQNGSLHQYLAIIVGCLIAAAGWPWAGRFLAVFRLPLAVDQLIAVGLVLLIAAATIVVLTADRRLTAICGLGGVGAGVALIFLSFGAPDIALTQLLVETLTVIIVSLVLPRLPSLQRSSRRRVRRRLLDGGLALAVGGLLTSLLMGVGRTPLDRSLTTYYEAESYLAAHGRNIVNVILVDFRALDTLGEITVVVLAAWAGIALIRKTKEP